jgi:hypothetical protein
MKSLPLAVMFVIPMLSGFSSTVQQQNATFFLPNSNGEVPLLIYFKSNDCTACDPFDQLLSEQITRVRIEQHYNVVCLNVDQSEGQICAEIYDVTTTPTLVIADRSGHIMFRSTTTLSDAEKTLILETFAGNTSVTPVMTDVDTSVRRSEDRLTDTQKNCIRNTGLAVRSEKQSPVLTATSDLGAGVNVDLAISKYRQPILLSHRNPAISEAIPEPVEEPVIDSFELAENTKTPATSSKELAGKWSYAIQLGYFSTTHNAMKLVRKASSTGLPDVRSESSQREGQEFFRVISGTYKSLPEAQKQLDAATSMGFKAAIYRW